MILNRYIARCSSTQLYHWQWPFIMFWCFWQWWTFPCLGPRILIHRSHWCCHRARRHFALFWQGTFDGSWLGRSHPLQRCFHWGVPWPLLNLWAVCQSRSTLFFLRSSNSLWTLTWDMLTTNTNLCNCKTVPLYSFWHQPVHHVYFHMTHAIPWLFCECTLLWGYNKSGYQCSVAYRNQSMVYSKYAFNELFNKPANKKHFPKRWLIFANSFSSSKGSVEHAPLVSGTVAMSLTFTLDVAHCHWAQKFFESLGLGPNTCFLFSHATKFFEDEVRDNFGAIHLCNQKDFVTPILSITRHAN